MTGGVSSLREDVCRIALANAITPLGRIEQLRSETNVRWRPKQPGCNFVRVANLFITIHTNAMDSTWAFGG